MRRGWDHTIFIAEVEDVRTREGEPLPVFPMGGIEGWERNLISVPVRFFCRKPCLKRLS